MKNEELKKASGYIKTHRLQKRWQKVVTCLAAVVVFCTTYALILPAITLEKEPCQIPEHTHSEACYAQTVSVTAAEPVCSIEKLDIHQHTADCYDENGNPVCGYSDFVVHEHDGSCYDEEGNLWCPLPEIKAHTHDGSCYAEAELGHTHTEACYTQERGSLICTEEESEGHTHSAEAGCYDETGALICQTGETAGHQHTDACYAWEQILNCGLTETEAGEPELVCGEEEIILHEHSAACFDENGSLICGKQQVLEHIHNADCFQTVEEAADAKTLTCDLEEHTHTAECNLPVELTEEEQAQVEEVITLIDALPAQAEMDETLAAFEDAGDEDGYDAYLMEIVTQAKAAYEAYSLLTEAQQGQVTNADRLLALEPLWSAQTLASNPLTADKAYVSGISITSYTTGTAPWDSDNNPGNDQSADNMVVRTFDEITYNFKVEYLTYDSSETFDDARVKLEFVLPATADQAEFKQSAMGWMEEPVLTTEKRTINGVETECQVLTCYKHLLPSEGHTSVVPGEFGENVTVNVKMMKNGDTLSPIFSAAMEYNTWNGTCAQNGHGTGKQSVVADDITISAAPKYNVQLKTAFATEARMTFDFSSGAETALNRNAGQVPGRIYTIGITLQLYNDSQDKGMRGVELPQGPITFDIKLSSEFRPNYSTATTTTPGTPTDVTADYTPLVWSFDEQSRAWNWDRDTSMTSYSLAFGSKTPLNRPDGRSDARDYSCYNGGTWSAVQNGDTVTFTVTDYEFDGIFPCVGVDEALSNATFYNKETGLRNIGCFSAAELYIVQPFQSNSTGKNVLDDFSTGGVHAQDHGNGSCLDGTFNLVVKDVNLTATSISGQALSTEPNGNTNQGGSNPAAKQDDSLTYTVAMKRPGGYEQRHLYSAKNSPGMNDIFGVNEVKPGTCAQNGNDWAVIGTEFGLTFGGYAKTNGEDANKMCAAKWLLKFDPEAIELIDSHSESSQASNNYNLKYLYAVKPDGTGWASDAEMKQTTMLELNYYATIAEAQSHGQIVGVMVEAMPKTTVAALPGGIVLTYFCQNARVKSDLSLANRRFIITEESMIWTVDDFEAAQGQIPTLLGNNPTNPTALPQQSYYVNSPSVYSNGDGTYDKHTGGYTHGDTLLVLTYKASIYKKLEQTEPNSTEAKYTYNLDSDQRVADFVLDPSVDYGGLQPEVKQTTTVTIVDTLPKYLTYRPGSCYFGGTYTQSSYYGGTQGTVTGGTLHEPYSIVNNADGTQTLTWVIPDVVIGEKMDLIHYSVNLGTKGQPATDVPEGTTEVTNVVEISAVGDDRPHSAVNGNRAEEGLQMTRGAASAYGKYSKQDVVEADGKIDYVIYYDNNAVTEATKPVLVDAMPVNGALGSNFTGTWKITSFKISLVGADTNTTLADLEASLHYTFDSAYKGKTLKDLQDSQGKPIGTWEADATINTDGTVTDLVGKAPVMWVLNCESLPGNSELRVEYTIQLVPEAGSTLDNVKYINQFSTGNTTTTTETPVVRRTLEGLTWMDDNGDGIQNEDANRRISGVKVELLKLKDGGDAANESDYEPYHYQGDSTLPVVEIETGKQVSVLASSASAATTYEPGRYKFTDLPAGTFAVRFTDGSKAISPLLASPSNRGTDDTKDSDGIATYTDNHATLTQTVILGIDMPTAENMSVTLYESKYHDSGFYEKSHELPNTGGHGTTPYTTGGLLLLTGAGVLLLYNHKKRREEDFASS